MEDNIQLKKEEVVGDEVILSDIYPKTNTGSVVDEASGRQLNETIDFLWQKINNKLSRVVNSVNNRTGVVVLSSDDVGLGNVDNVSFADIKQWVIDLLIQEFGNKRIRLVEHLDEIDQLIREPYDLTLRDTPFFSKYGYSADNDKKSYIGYIYYDKATSSLKCAYRSIRVVGSTDQSLLYNDDNGNLKTHIWSGQDIIKVRDTGVTEDSGLYLDENELYKGIRYFDGVYDGTYTDPVKGQVYVHGFSNPLVTSGSYQQVVIGKYIGSSYNASESYQYIATVLASNTDKFHIGEYVYCGFQTLLNNAGNIPTSLSKLLMNHEPGVGTVTRYGATDPSTKVQIIFYPIKYNVGWGIQNTPTLSDSMIDSTKPNYDPGIAGHQLEISLATVKRDIWRDSHTDHPYLKTVTSNISGLQIISNRNSLNTHNNGKIYEDEATLYTNLPFGPMPIFQDETRNGGIFINPDSSLCIIPSDRFTYTKSSSDGSEADWSTNIRNWCPADLGDRPAAYWERLSIENDEDLPNDGIRYRPTTVGVNLLKVIRAVTSDRYNMLDSQNISGLRVITSASDYAEDDNKIDYKFLGLNYGELEQRYPGATLMSSDKALHRNSGGVAINIGKFLEIDPGVFTFNSHNWNSMGKVAVRIGKGLEEEPITYDEHNHQITGNRIQLKLSDGLSFDENGALKVPGTLSSCVVLDMVDTYDTHVVYNPIPQSEDPSSGITKSTITLQLGKGLKLITDDMSVDTYVELVNGLTGKQLEYYINDASTMTVSLLRAKINALINNAEDNISILQSEIDKIHQLQTKYPSTMSTLPHYSKTLAEMNTIALNKGYTSFEIANMTLIGLENVCILDDGVTLKDYIMNIFNQVTPYHVDNSVTAGRLLNVYSVGVTGRLVTNMAYQMYGSLWEGSFDGCDPSLKKYYDSPELENSFEKVKAIGDAVVVRINSDVHPTSTTQKVNEYLWEYTFAELMQKYYIAKGIGDAEGVISDSDKSKLVALVETEKVVTTQDILNALEGLKSSVTWVDQCINTIRANGVSGLSANDLHMCLCWTMPQARTIEGFVKLIITAEGG